MSKAKEKEKSNKTKKAMIKKLVLLIVGVKYFKFRNQKFGVAILIIL